MSGGRRRTCGKRVTAWNQSSKMGQPGPSRLMDDPDLVEGHDNNDPDNDYWGSQHSRPTRHV